MILPFRFFPSKNYSLGKTVRVTIRKILAEERMWQHFKWYFNSRRFLAGEEVVSECAVPFNTRGYKSNGQAPGSLPRAMTTRMHVSFYTFRADRRKIVARVYVILNAKRGEEILQGAWLFYAPRTKHFNVGPPTTRSPTTSRQLHLAFPLSRLFMIYQSRLPPVRVITTGPNLHAKLRIKLHETAPLLRQPLPRPRGMRRNDEWVNACRRLYYRFFSFSFSYNARW